MNFLTPNLDKAFQTQNGLFYDYPVLENVTICTISRQSMAAELRSEDAWPYR
ncbi:hypothetical protein AM1_4990 [Acaryochloris marina MBIC11017]|uniref:Uncharacterized protein n=1 Tax=Acaryochloris marina (strain MBIC 11017) TaxID=329726 RepID=B0C5U6_ACAM1|nr:hypothetical protein AM1_4990 [Acaryochloris marina MBIC11017]